MSEKLITSAAVKARFGGISDMCLWRWLQDERVGFPAPIYIARRRYWREADIDAFITAKARARLERAA